MATSLPSPPYSPSFSKVEEKDFSDFAPRRSSVASPNDGNNNSGQKALRESLALSKAALINVKKEKFSQKQEHQEETEEEESSTSSDEDEDCIILVRSSREDSDPLEIPVDDEDGSLELATLQAYFPGASGLAKRNKKTGNLRLAYKIVDDFLHPLDGDFINATYEVIWPRKKKRCDSDDDESDRAGPPAGKRRRNEPSSAPKPFSAAEISLVPNFNFTSAGPSFSDVASGRFQSKPVASKPAAANRGCYNVSHNGPTAMFVKDLPYGFDREDLKEVKKYFARFGPVHTVDFDNDHKRAIVRFGDAHSANQAFGSHSINGDEIVAVPSGYREDKKASMFLHSVPRGMSQSTLVDYFNQYGQVLYVFIPRQKSGYKKYGFVQFKEPASAAHAGKRSQHNVDGSFIGVDISRISF